MSVAEEQLRLWIEDVLDIRVILEDQDDPSAPRRLKEDDVDTYAAISLDTDASLQSTPYETTAGEYVTTTASAAVPGGTTPAKTLPLDDVFGFTVESLARIEAAAGDRELEILDVTDDPPALGFEVDAIDFDVAKGDPVVAVGTVTRVRSEVVQGTLAVEIYGKDAEQKARKLRLARGAQAYMLRFAAQEITLTTQGQIVDEPVLRSATREPQAAMLFGARWVEQDFEPIPVAASYEGEATATGGTP